MTSKEYLGMCIGERWEGSFLYVNATKGTEIFDTLDGESRWTIWQYDDFTEDPPNNPKEIVLPIEFLT